MGKLEREIESLLIAAQNNDITNYVKVNINCNPKNIIYRNVCGVMDTIVGNEHNNTSSNPGQVCISHCANTLRKSMNPTILPPAMCK